MTQPRLDPWHRSPILAVHFLVGLTLLLAACGPSKPAATAAATAAPTSMPATTAPTATAARPTAVATAAAAATTAATQPAATATQAAGLAPGWQLYANGNSINALSLDGQNLYAATSDGVVVWDLASGKLVKHLTFRDGLTNNHATAIAACPLPGQPPLIIGTHTGLDLYDLASNQGQHLTQAAGALHGGEVSALGCDLTNGRGLIGYTGDGVDIFDANTHKFTHVGASDGLVSDQVTALAYISATNEIWVGSPFGVSIIGAKGIKTLTKAANKFPDDDIRSITSDAAGTVWLGTFAGLIKYAKGAAQFYTSQTVPNFPGTAGAVAVAPDGTLWVAGLGGDFCHFDPKTAKCLGAPASPVNGSFYSSVAVDAQGQAYLGSQGQGVGVFSGSGAKAWALTDVTLATNNVQALAGDASGKLWVLTDKGAYRLDPKDMTAKWDFFPADDSGLASGAASVLLADPKQGMWFGGYSGASYYDGAAWKHFTAKDNGLLDDDIRALAIDAQGQVWLGGPKGLSILAGTKVTQLTKKDGLPDDDIQALLADGTHVWVGTGAGGLLRFDGGKWQAFTQASAGLPSDDIRTLARASDGTLLVGTSGGLGRFDGQKAAKAELDNETVIALALGPDGQPWAGTVFSGGFHYDGSQWQPLPTLPGSTVLALYVDALGAAWFGLEKDGLARYVPGAVGATANPTAAPQPTAAGTSSAVALGAQQALPNTPYHYSPPANWSATPFGGAIVLAASDADPVTGPSITLAGGAQAALFPKDSASATLDDLLTSYVNTWLSTAGAAQVANRRDAMVGGQPARVAEVQWSTAQYAGFSGRLVIAQPSAGQIFIMLGGGTAAKAPAVLADMDAMLTAVHFQ